MINGFPFFVLITSLTFVASLFTLHIQKLGNSATSKSHIMQSTKVNHKVEETTRKTHAMQPPKLTTETQAKNNRVKTEKKTERVKTEMKQNLWFPTEKLFHSRIEI